MYRLPYEIGSCSTYWKFVDTTNNKIKYSFGQFDEQKLVFIVCMHVCMWVCKQVWVWCRNYCRNACNIYIMYIFGHRNDTPPWRNEVKVGFNSHAIKWVYGWQRTYLNPLNYQTNPNISKHGNTIMCSHQPFSVFSPFSIWSMSNSNSKQQQQQQLADQIWLENFFCIHKSHRIKIACTILTTIRQAISV